jgi:type IV pilus assembly protein PilF
MCKFSTAWFSCNLGGPLHRSLLTLMLLLGLSSMYGCAANRLSGQDAGQEIVTDSDEPEPRRRARIRLELAVGYFEQGQTTVALDELKQSLASDSSYPDAYNLRGLIYMRLNDFKFAEESFRKALDLNPRDSSVLHNLGWLLCQQAKYAEASQTFARVLSNPLYGERAKTFRAQGLCQVRAGQRADAEASLLKSYEFDAANPVTAYNLATLMLQRGDFARAQFYIRRLNNTELANSESLWLGIKVERRMENRDAMLQLGAQLVKRFPQSIEAGHYQRGAFDE